MAALFEKPWYFKTKDGLVKKFTIGSDLTIIQTLDEKSTYIKNTSLVIREMTTNEADYTDKYDEQYKNFDLWYQNVLDTVQIVIVVMSSVRIVVCDNIKTLLCKLNNQLGAVYSSGAEEVHCNNNPVLEKILTPNAILHYSDAPRLNLALVSAKEIKK